MCQTVRLVFKEQGLKRKAKLLTPPPCNSTAGTSDDFTQFLNAQAGRGPQEESPPQVQPTRPAVSRVREGIWRPLLVMRRRSWWCLLKERHLFHGAVGAQAWVACSHSPRCLETLGDPPPRGASPARSSNPLPQLPPAPDVPVPLSSWEFATPVFLLARCPWLSDRLEWWKGHWLWT